MGKGQQRDPAREAKWRQILARHGRSGLSVRVFCRGEELPESAFYAWRRAIQQRDAQREAAPAFVPLMVQTDAAAGDGAAIVELRGGRMLRLPLSMPAVQLAALIHAIEQAGDAA
jgi:transposase-like protein